VENLKGDGRREELKIKLFLVISEGFGGGEGGRGVGSDI